MIYILDVKQTDYQETTVEKISVIYYNDGDVAPIKFTHLDSIKHFFLWDLPESLPIR